LPNTKNDFTKKSTKTKLVAGVESPSGHHFTTSGPVLDTSRRPLFSSMFVMCRSPLIVDVFKKKREQKVGHGRNRTVDPMAVTVEGGRARVLALPDTAEVI
jgi:hypothetical protein